MAVLLPLAGVAVTAKQAAPAVVVVRAARVLDVVSGQLLRNATVVVTGTGSRP